MRAMASPPPPPDLSPASALLMVFAAAIGPELAPFASAYSLILLGWFAGLLIGTYMRPPDGKRLPIAAFAFVSLVVVLGVTVPLSRAIAGYASAAAPGAPIDAQALFLAVAVAIPAVGYRWRDVGGWLVGLLRRRFEGGKS